MQLGKVRMIESSIQQPDSQQLKVLIVEDSADDAELIAFELRQHGYQPTYERVATAADMLAALARQIWEVVNSDDYNCSGKNSCH